MCNRKMVKKKKFTQKDSQDYWKQFVQNKKRVNWEIDENYQCISDEFNM